MVGLLSLGIVAVLVVALTPFFQTQLIGWAFASLEQRYGVVGHVDILDVNLARFDIRFRGLTLAARDRSDETFFTVDEARINLPWSALWDEISIQALTLVRPRLSVRTDADGVSNLPSIATDAAAVPAVERRAGTVW